MFTESESFLLGTVLGDGNLHRRYKWDRVCSIKLAHAPKELEWLKWKVEKTEKILGSRANITPCLSNGVLKAYQWCAGFSNYVHLYDELYKNDKKTFTPALLSQLGLQELAMFWCDDGGVVKNLRKKIDYRTGRPYPNPLQETQGNLAVYESETETSVVGEWIKALTGAFSKVSFHKKTGLYYLRFNKRSLELLCSSIQDFVPECMKHKIDLTLIPISERAQVLRQRAIRRHECAATLKVDDIV